MAIKLKVLVACEFSGIVRNSFTKIGHDAWSCDLLPTELPGQHYQLDAVNVCKLEHWDIIIAHPPCTLLTVAGARWWAEREREKPGCQREAAEFAMCFEQYAEKVCTENPIGRLSTIWRRPEQIIQPWQFGHGETKATCLWLKNLPCLVPTNIVSGRDPRVHYASPSPDRWKERSRTLQGIADAMAMQWGGIVE